MKINKINFVSEEQLKKEKENGKRKFELTKELWTPSSGTFKKGLIGELVEEREDSVDLRFKVEKRKYPVILKNIPLSNVIEIDNYLPRVGEDKKLINPEIRTASLTVEAFIKNDDPQYIMFRKYLDKALDIEKAKKALVMDSKISDFQSRLDELQSIAVFGTNTVSHKNIQILIEELHKEIAKIKKELRDHLKTFNEEMLAYQATANRIKEIHNDPRDRKEQVKIFSDLSKEEQDVIKNIYFKNIKNVEFVNVTR